MPRKALLLATTSAESNEVMARALRDNEDVPSLTQGQLDYQKQAQSSCKHDIFPFLLLESSVLLARDAALH